MRLPDGCFSAMWWLTDAELMAKAGLDGAGLRAMSDEQLERMACGGSECATCAVSDGLDCAGD
jgi:hypothetical protein